MIYRREMSPICLLKIFFVSCRFPDRRSRNMSRQGLSAFMSCPMATMTTMRKMVPEVQL